MAHLTPGMSELHARVEVKAVLTGGQFLSWAQRIQHCTLHSRMVMGALATDGKAVAKPLAIAAQLVNDKT